MAKNEYIDYVLALGRLYEFCSNKRFHLIKNEFINDFIGQKALEINNKIKIQTGIDIFESRDEKDLLEYETTLSLFTTQHIDNTFGIKHFDDEVDLLRNQIPFASEKIGNFKLSINAGLEAHLKRYELTKQNVINICQKPDFVAYIEDCGSFFITRKTTLRSREKLILAHLSYDDPANHQNYVGRHRDSYLHRERGGLKNLSTNPNLLTHLFIIFDYDEYKVHLESPIHLFLKALDLYGAKTEVNGVIKRLHRNVILPPHYSTDRPFYNLVDDKSPSIRSISFWKKSRIAITIIMLYAIHMQKAIRDYLDSE